MIPKLKAQPKVSIVIPFKDGGLLLEKCLQSVYEKSTYANFEVIAIDNNSVELATSQLIERYLARPNFKFFKYNKPFNYAAINNFAVSKAQGEYVVLVNSDIEILSPDWLESLSLCPTI
ncbi:MAG: glycosyltransferase [Bdellovibrionales bacterium]|nr:glycosyltransferase [Bdellovibrionales bacterium]